MTRVLVTGASGFLGRQALPLLLAHGHEVHALARRRQTAGADGKIVWHEADLLDAGASAELVRAIRPEQLLHLAWGVEPGRFWTSTENVRWVEASLALMRAFVAADGRRAVFAGTCAEYEWTSSAGPADPNAEPREWRMRERATPIVPATLYGACKHATHLVAAKLAAQSGVQLGWGRVFYLYGPHEQQARLVPAIATSLLRAEPTDTSNGRQRRDFMHVADVAAAFVALLESEVDGPVNIATGEAVEVGEVVRMIATNAGGEELLRWGAIARSPSEPDTIVADVSRLRDEVGFVAQIGLADGLRETVEWWRRQLADVPPPGASPR